MYRPLLMMALLLPTLGLSVRSAEPVGVAVVINAVQEVELPDLERVAAEPDRIAREFRAAGLRVATDPSGRCLAVTPPPDITDGDLIAGVMPNAVLMTGIAERVTPEQCALRDHGYLREEALSESQRAAFRHVARRCQWIDTQGKVKEAGAHLSLGIWPTWTLQVATARNGQADCIRRGTLPRPPSLAAIPHPPLAGSLLWWARVDDEAAFGREPISIPAGNYLLRDLTAKLAAAGGCTIAVHENVPDMLLAVAAADMPLRGLLWAVEAATGYPVRVQNAEPLSVIVALPAARRYPLQEEDTNLLLPVANFGYLSAMNAENGRKMLATLDAPSPEWIGWRFSELPAMYRNQINRAWQQRDPNLPALDPEHTIVLWCKSLLISPGTQQDDGSGGGYEYTLPAL
jgi:hypothetical protein